MAFENLVRLFLFPIFYLDLFFHFEDTVFVIISLAYLAIIGISIFTFFSKYHQPFIEVSLYWFILLLTPAILTQIMTPLIFATNPNLSLTSVVFKVIEFVLGYSPFSLLLGGITIYAFERMTNKKWGLASSKVKGLFLIQVGLLILVFGTIIISQGYARLNL